MVLPTAATPLAAARAGDRAAFEALVQPLERGLRADCDRMLGSLAEADDAAQEALLRAWKGLAGFEGRAQLRTWLYQIATRVCLDAAQSRKARTLPTAVHPAAPEGAMPAPDLENAYLDPAPDAYLDDGPVGPDVRVERKEGVALAFLVTLQALPASQRAVLVLRDVLGLQASEVAELLETTVPAVNSALQRARATLEARGDRPPSLHASEEAERSMLEKYLQVWETSDVPALVRLLRDDAVLTMPPMAQWFAGPGSIAAFLGRIAFPPGDPQRFRAVRLRSMGLPGLAVYRRERPGAPWVADTVHLLELDGERIARFHVWVVPSLVTRFGLAAEIT